MRVLLVGLLVLAVAGCGGDATGPASDGQPEPADESPSDAQPGDGTGDGNDDASEGADVEAAVAVEGGQVAGGVARVRAGLGDRVALTVTTDVADTVHVHGYDLEQPVAPDQPARVAFTADIPGVFEVELEEAGLKLADVEVGG